MAGARKRRASRQEEEDEVAAELLTQASTRRRQRRASDSSAGESAGEFEEVSMTQGDGGGSLEQMTKNLVRLALASEYSRQPIRRSDISAKVLGSHGRQFRNVFTEAQGELRDKFGMEMVELPLKEKVTVAQRRAAQRSEKTATTSNSWILRSILPPAYRSNTTILPPPKVPTDYDESTYIALYTFIISLISLSGGAIAEAKLDRYLRRTNTDQYTPLDKTEKLLAQMCKDGYLVKVKDTSTGEESIEYLVGPRGKLEVGEAGVTGLIKTVYGDSVEPDDMDKRIKRSLGIQENAATSAENGGATEIAPNRGPGRPRRAADEEDDDGSYGR
ncbi:MAGE-domain-containing protein [Xylona heveae TC161]|uniref:MAGE-domain-containing protein n=1 Tax=Xylona heveae (strain CBS 132557 / TC161) TaxID=1328760 RepID=A0A165GHD8_XYLHT|nr:MAGE-domain-containing protein [Xylona heveae TC161]KZF22185.1 MAGE-domain-containing protein [Xylona heveae TC161]